MREVDTEKIYVAIREGFMKINYCACEDITDALTQSLKVETSIPGVIALKNILKNNELARREKIAMCQDTGIAIVFSEIGQDVHIVGENYKEVINRAVGDAYKAGYLRKSVVKDPLFSRENTQDNTPAIIYTEIIPGDKLRFAIISKGFGSENKSRVKMFIPADGIEKISDFVVETVKIAGGNACPPLIVGVGVGGTMEKAALMAKKAAIRPINEHNCDERYAALESELLQRINRTGIGPGGLGGNVTALSVNIDWSPTHIASIPVAVNLCCHASRHTIIEV